MNVDAYDIVSLNQFKSTNVSLLVSDSPFEVHITDADETGVAGVIG